MRTTTLRLEKEKNLLLGAESAVWKIKEDY